MRTWKVKYQEVITRNSRRPFFKQERTVEANSRIEAIEIVKSDNYYGKTDRYTASAFKPLTKEK